jgi:hypothetical protein
MSVATDVPPPQSETVAEVHPIRARFPLLAIVLIAISVLATMLWTGALVWLLSELMRAL